MKLLTVVGARPQFIKAATVSRAITHRSECFEVMVHTGQHFDTNMSDVFFEELGISRPKYHLGIGGGSHGQNTGRMLEAIEQVILNEQPTALLVYGDTDSTLAGALAASKLHVPVVHVEAGLRSFNKRMPEEINRVLTDHISELLLTPSDQAIVNLKAEGVFGEKVRNVGDVMFDAALYYGSQASERSKILNKLGLSSKEYILATIHRQENTDNPERLKSILEAFGNAIHPVVLPLHPRTKKKLADFGLSLPSSIAIVEPLGYLDMVMIEQHACLIATDSGGVQKEAYFHKVPCITLRNETEWTELVEMGWNRLISPDSPSLVEAFACDYPLGTINVSPYGTGDAAVRVVNAMLQIFV